jgi:cyclohexa-1,5-dienecarbonyl-CoA hydratase
MHDFRPVVSTLAGMIPVEVTVAGRVACVRLNAPPLNILTSSLQDELQAAMTDLRRRDDHNVVVLQSAIGNVFSGGADVDEHVGVENCRRMLTAAHSLIAELLRSPVPTVCLVDGDCLGGAFELALACDQIHCTPASRFGLPEIRLGCYPPAALVLTAWKLPAQLAAEMIQSGRLIPGQRLVACGAAAEGAAPDLPAETYANLPRGPLVEATRLMRSGSAERFLSAVGPIETAYFERLLTLRDAKEGPEAFLAKRKPVWDHSSV